MILRFSGVRRGKKFLSETLIILVIALIIFGAGKLPQIGSGIGNAIRNFKKGVADVETEIKEEPEKIEAGQVP